MLQDTGIAGLRDRARVKCLHAHYAMHLAARDGDCAAPNPVGRWVDEALARTGSARPPTARSARGGAATSARRVNFKSGFARASR